MKYILIVVEVPEGPVAPPEWVGFLEEMLHDEATNKKTTRLSANAWLFPRDSNPVPFARVVHQASRYGLKVSARYVAED